MTYFISIPVAGMLWRAIVKYYAFEIASAGVVVDPVREHVLQVSDVC
jgi:hypothetical protein